MGFFKFVSMSLPERYFVKVRNKRRRKDLSIQVILCTKSGFTYSAELLSAEIFIIHQLRSYTVLDGEI